MTETNQDIPRDGDDRYVAGDTAVITDTVQTDDGSAKNLTGADVAFALADYPGDDPIVNKTSNDSDVTITDAANGVVEVELQPTDTEGLGSPEGEDYYYEIEARDATGDAATVTTGTWTIYPDTASLP